MENIKEWEERIEAIRWEYMGYQLWFRGHGRTSYLLKPTIARQDHTVSSLIAKEDQELNTMKQDVPSYELGVDLRHLIKNEWLSLMQAQHLRYQTRLIDWTLSLRVALYFAVENESYHNEDSHLCILPANFEDVILDEQLLIISPKHLSKTTLINAARSANFSQCLGERRRTLQMGMFSISPYKEALIELEQNEFWNYRIIKEIIPSESKKALKEELECCGITHETIYVRQLK